MSRRIGLVREVRMAPRYGSAGRGWRACNARPGGPQEYTPERGATVRRDRYSLLAKGCCKTPYPGRGAGPSAWVRIYTPRLALGYRSCRQPRVEPRSRLRCPVALEYPATGDRRRARSLAPRQQRGRRALRHAPDALYGSGRSAGVGEASAGSLHRLIDRPQPARHGWRSMPLRTSG